MKSFVPLLAVLCLLATALPAFASPSSFDGLTITRIILKDESGNSLAGSDQITQLISVKPGGLFSGAAIREGLALLYLKGTFRDIRVDGFPENGGVRLEYTFIPITIVDSVVIKGNSALSQAEITGALPRLTGKELREDRFPELKADLEELYQARGFSEASFSFRVEKLAAHRVALRVDIHEGAPTVIEKIIFSGNRALGDNELLSVMTSRIGSPLVRDILLDADREAIAKKYADAGYPKAATGPVSISFENHRATIRIPCSEGPRVQIRYLGNNNIKSAVLNQAILIWSEHDISDAVIGGSADKIKDIYRERGYADVSVDVSKTEKPGKLDLDFIINEGPRLAVVKIEFTGNTVFSSEQLQKGMALRERGWFTAGWYREDLLDKDVENIRDRYVEADYLSATVRKSVVRSADGLTASITLEITEGARTTTGSVTFEGNTVFLSSALLDKLSTKPGAPYNERLVDDDKYRILSLYSNKGYLYARVDVDKTPRDGTVDVHYRITEDQIVRVGKIVLKGNEHTKDYVILRELLVKPGDAYDYGAMLSSQQRIYRLGYFRLAEFEPIHPGEREYVKDVLFDVEERPAGVVQFGAGYGDLDRLRGFVELSYRNLWGTARYTSLRYEESDILKRAIFSYKEPWFLDRDMDATVSLAWSDSERLNSDTRFIYYNTRSTSASFGVEKSFDTFKPSLTYEFENVVNYNVQPGAELSPDDSGRVLVNSLNPALTWDLRDDAFNPRSGALFGVVLKEALRELYSQADFTKLTAQGSWFVPLSSMVLALSARGGMAWPFSNTNVVPLHERFYAGGGTTVRGYTQDSIGPSVRDVFGNVIPQGGQSMAVFNVELRVNPGKGLGFVLFSDAGNVWPGQEFGISDLRSSYGAGIRYGTPIGPLRIDYGQKIHRRPGESPGELHFNIGNSF
ncbi:MAG TPA: outer membrane protein assembly factor BamA [Nitrospirota bacterium]|nr:outer membrane protein assembly factor BamA [Nitrospirota bacterium]